MPLPRSCFLLGVLFTCGAPCAAAEGLALPERMAAADWDRPYRPANVFQERVPIADVWQLPYGSSGHCSEPWVWRVLPDGVIYPSYLAGPKEPRLALTPFHDTVQGNLADATLGGRIGLLRFGTAGDWRPEGWQLDLEAAAQPRLDLDEEVDLIATDFRAGVWLTRGQGAWQVKFGAYHLSSHLGDEFIQNTGAVRINYSRDVAVVGLSYRPLDQWRLYAEAGWAWNTDGGSQPWEFQFGAEFAPLPYAGPWGGPFLAANVQVREEVDFGGGLTVQTGWMFRGDAADRRLRVGVQYYNGKSLQYEFFRQNEEQIGAGIWYDY